MTYAISENASIFTDLERATHLITEKGLVMQAENGDASELYIYWAEKKVLFMRRTALRNPYQY